MNKLCTVSLVLILLASVFARAQVHAAPSRSAKVVVDVKKTAADSEGKPVSASVLKDIFFNSQGFGYTDPRDGKGHFDTPFLRKAVRSLGGKWGTEFYLLGDPPVEGGESDGSIAVSQVSASECSGSGGEIPVDPVSGLPEKTYVSHAGGKECYQLDFQYFNQRLADHKEVLGFDDLYLITGMTPQCLSCAPSPAAPSEEDPAKDYYVHIYFGPKDLRLHREIMKAAFTHAKEFSRRKLGVRRIIAQVRDEPMSYNFMGSCGPGGPHNHAERFRDYVDLFKTEYRAIKEVDPSIIVIGNGAAVYSDELSGHVSGSGKLRDNDAFRQTLAKEAPEIARGYVEAVQSYHWAFTASAYPELVPEKYQEDFDFESRLLRRHIARERAKLGLPVSPVILPGWNDGGIPELKPGETLTASMRAPALKRSAAYVAGFMIKGLPVPGDKSLAPIERADLWPFVGHYYADGDRQTKSLFSEDIFNQAFFAVHLDNPKEGRVLPAGQVLQMFAQLAEAREAYFASTAIPELKGQRAATARSAALPPEAIAVVEYGPSKAPGAVKGILVNYHEAPCSITVQLQNLSLPKGAKATLKKLRDNGLDLEGGSSVPVISGEAHSSIQLEMEPFDVIFFQVEVKETKI